MEEGEEVEEAEDGDEGGGGAEDGGGDVEEAGGVIIHIMVGHIHNHAAHHSYKNRQ